MTLKQFIEKALETAEKFQKSGDHENYRRCIEIIAEATADAYYSRVEA